MSILNSIKGLINKIIDLITIKQLLCAGIIIISIFVIFVLITNLIVCFSVKDNIKTVEEITDTDIDCIIVLGARVRDKRPTGILEDRIIVGMKLYNAQVASKFIMSGDHGHVEYDEVNSMKKYAIDRGIPSSDIFMDHAGFSTYETMYRAKEVFGAKKVVIVTQKYHLYRSLYDAEKLGLKAYGVDSDLRIYGKNSYRSVREWFARTKDFVKVICKPSSTYVGEKIDLSGDGDVTNDKYTEL